MEREGHDDVVFFVGSEIEFTPAYSMRTLFVVGIQDADEIIRTAQKHECVHIYLGANQSFEPSDDWDILINTITKHKDFMVTLDFDVIHCEWVLEGGYDECDNFISMISVKVPYIKLFNYNACIKVDDKDFAATNPGVWTHRVHDLQNTNVFTSWSKYTQDKVIESDSQFEQRIKGLRHEDYMRERQWRDDNG